ncbi:hypothetical protein Tco_1351654 [Tanacetum coccineum]
MIQKMAMLLLREKNMVVKKICLDCWMEKENKVGRTFDARPLPSRQSMWYSCRMYLYRKGNTTDRGVVADVRAGSVGNTTTAGRGGGVVGLGVAASSRVGGSVGIGHGSGGIIRPEVIYDCMSPTLSDSSKEESEPITSLGLSEPHASH